MTVVGILAATAARRRVRAALACGALVATCGARPLPESLWSWVMLTFLGAGVALSGAASAWWVLAGAAATAVVAVGNTSSVLLAVAAFVTACAEGLSATRHPLLRLMVAGAVAIALARSQFSPSFFAASTAHAVLVCGAIVVHGATSGRVVNWRFARRAAARIAAAVFVAVVGAAVAGWQAKDALERGDAAARAGLRALNQGDFDRAAGLFTEAHTAFAEGDAQLARPWAWPAHLVPGLAHQTVAAGDLAEAAATATGAIAEAVGQIDADAVRVRDGRIDLAAIEALDTPFSRLSSAFAVIDGAAASADSGWLLDPLAGSVRSLRNDLHSNGVRLRNARAAVDLAPQMLGADGQRVYLVLFTTPAEARGLGGFPGNFAELTATDGALEMTRFGRWSDLEDAIAVPTLHIDGPDGFLARYGAFGYERSANGQLKGSPWRNITMPPDFPTVAQVAAELYPQSGGRQIDGVMVADVFVLQALLGITGPITVDGWDVPIGSDNAAAVLLRDQYTIEVVDERVDFLADVAHATIDRVLRGALPGPVELGQALGPLATEGRLLMWTDEPAEQAMLAGVNLLGAFPADPMFGGADGFGVALTNVGGNKLDTYLQRTYDYSTDHGPGGSVRAELHMTLRNSAPSVGLPPYVDGNGLGLPRGTNRVRVCVSSPLDLVSYRVDDGTVTPWERIEEFGGHSYCRSVNIAAGDSVELALDLAGSVPRPDLPVAVWRQPLVLPADITIEQR